MGGMTVSDVANEALDAIGWPLVLGDIEDGSHHAQIVLRKYRQCLAQMLRAVNWNFARKSAPLTLLADASGNTPTVGSAVPNPNFIYEYAYPTDCMKARFVPWQQGSANLVPAANIAAPATPLVTGIGQPALAGGRIRPARFLVASDFNYPPPAGQITWDVQGVSPQSRTVVLTNVRDAVLVYTTLVLYPSVWDPLFRAALVAYLASEIALPIWTEKDRKFGLQVRGEQEAIAARKVMEARVIDGIENPSSSDIAVDWMRTRNVGGPWSGAAWHGAGGGDDGVFGYGFDPLPLASGAVF